MDAEQWLRRHTFRCAIGRVSPEQCKALRERPVFDPDMPGSGPYKPKQCMECKEWREKMSTASPERKCGRCGETKPVTEFGKKAGGKDGLQPWCRECKRRYDREYRKKKQASRQINRAPEEKDRARKTDRPACAVHADRPALSADRRDPLRCALCRRQLNWYDGERDMGFVMEHYVLPAGPVCIVCFSRLYGMQGFEEGWEAGRPGGREAVNALSVLQQGL